MLWRTLGAAVLGAVAGWAGLTLVDYLLAWLFFPTILQRAAALDGLQQVGTLGLALGAATGAWCVLAQGREPHRNIAAALGLWIGLSCTLPLATFYVIVAFGARPAANPSPPLSLKEIAVFQLAPMAWGGWLLWRVYQLRVAGQERELWQQWSDSLRDGLRTIVRPQRTDLLEHLVLLAPLTVAQCQDRLQPLVDPWSSWWASLPFVERRTFRARLRDDGFWLQANRGAGPYQLRGQWCDTLDGTRIVIDSLPHSVVGFYLVLWFSMWFGILALITLVFGIMLIGQLIG